MRLIFIGPPGAGKGTQLSKLSEHFDIQKLSTGDMLRDEIQRGTPIGLEVEGIIANGSYVADEIVLGLVRDRLGSEEFGRGFILDGFPRTLAQADRLWGLLSERGLNIDAAVYLNVDDDVIIERMAGRISCAACGKPYNMFNYPPKIPGICDDCGGRLVQRDDDRPETVSRRLGIYRELTEPIIEYYRDRGLLIEVDGVGDAGSISEDIISRLERN